MNNPFQGRAFGARAAGPQFPQRRAQARAPKKFAGGGLFGGDDQDLGMPQPSGLPMSQVRSAPQQPIQPPPVAPPPPPTGGEGGGGGGIGDIAKLAMQVLPFFLKEGGRVPEKPPGFFLGGLFSSSPASSTTSSHSQTNFQVSDPNYTNLMDDVLKRGLKLSNQEYQPYTGQGVVGLTDDQKAAFANVREGQGNYKPFFNQAGDAVTRAAGYDPASAGMGYVDQAGNMTTGSQAASPFIGQASQTFPGAVGDYMSPYTDSVVKGIQDASNRNFEQNTMKTINDTFSGGNAAQFGREQHGNVVGNAVYAKSQADNAAVANALESGYATAGNLFNQDANRAAGLAGLSGQLAQGDIAQRAGLGTTAAGITAQGANTALNTAVGAQNLGTATQQAGLTDANALTASGSQQQTQAQNEETWKYNQFKEKINDPYQKALFGQGISQGWTLPTQTDSNSTSTTTQQGGGGSPFGQILGAGIGLLGAAGGIPGLSSLGSLFGGAAGSAAGGSVSAAGAPSSGYGGYAGYANTLPGFPGYRAEGGQAPEYAAGGMIPAVAAMRKATKPKQPKGPTPTGMPGMAPLPTLAPIRPKGQPNGQMASPFARGGKVSDAKQDKRMVKKAVHQHEAALHKGSPFTKLKLANGGSVSVSGGHQSPFTDTKRGARC